jgi:hypothetical protein
MVSAPTAGMKPRCPECNSVITGAVYFPATRAICTLNHHGPCCTARAGEIENSIAADEAIAEIMSQDDQGDDPHERGCGCEDCVDARITEAELEWERSTGR